MLLSLNNFSNSKIEYSYKLGLSVSLITLLIFYLVYTPDFALTIDDEGETVKDHTMIFVTSLLIGTSASLVVILKDIKPVSKQNTTSETKPATILASYKYL